jgi:hypothetical protein
MNMVVLSNMNKVKTLKHIVLGYASDFSQMELSTFTLIPYLINTIKNKFGSFYKTAILFFNTLHPGNF